MNEFSIKISVVIVTYNSEEVIAESLNSILQAGSKFNYQIIVIDNNSRDKTVEIVKSLINTGKQKIILRENNSNLGFARGVNQGLTAANGDFILLMNPDVILSKDFFENIIKPFRIYPDIGAAAPQHIGIDEKILPSCRSYPDYRTLFFELFLLSRIFKNSPFFNKWRIPRFDHKTELFNCQPMGSCLMITKKTFETTGFIDERFFLFFNDVDYCRRIIESGLNILFYPEAKIIHYKGHSIYKHRIRSIYYSHLGFYRYLNKYYKNIFEKLLNIPIFILLSLSGLVRILFYLFRGQKK